MPEPVSQSTSDLIEQARLYLQGEYGFAVKSSNQKTWWFCGGLILLGLGLGASASGASVVSYSDRDDWSQVLYPVTGGFVACAVLILLGLLAIGEWRRAREKTKALQILDWLENQLRNGIITDAEARAEILQLMR